MLGSMNTYDIVPPQGVPNPYRPMVHAYPTRYHGPIYDRPMYALPWATRPYDFAVERGTEGLGEIDPAMYTPMWAVGLRDMLKSKDDIATDCQRMTKASPDEIMACAGGRIVASQSARAAVAVGVTLGVVGTWFMMRRRR
jgi:hypothetical protein